MQRKELICGAYKITCTGNNKFYIGSSKDICNRWLHHLSDLRLGKHHSIYLQRSYNKYGEESITFSVLHRMDEYNEQLLRLLEYYYIEELHPDFNSGIYPCPIDELSEEVRAKISETTKKLYTEKGYINPRKGVGKKYNVYDINGKSLFQEITMDELSHKMDIRYHTFNTMLRKYGGICCSTKNNCIIMEVTKTMKDVISLYKTTLFYRNCPVCDLDGNIYKRGGNYYIKSRPHKGVGITFKSIYKNIMKSDLLYFIVNDKVFTLPFLGHFIQQCISKTPEYPRKLSQEIDMPT